MRRLIVLGILCVCGALPAVAREGMWQPYQLPRLGAELARLGLELEPRSMTELTGHPMNAVISLGGCSASFVSPNGLLVTNHHCLQGSIQYNSTAESNLLEQGFLAERLADELQGAPGSRVWVTVESRDVTERILHGISDELRGEERFLTIERREKALVAECERDAGHRCTVYAFHDGLTYFLMKRMEIRDVRLVYAPPGSIGDYGGEIDNWMWPRHTGDYAFARAWVGKDGKPADPADDNVPYRPRHWLRVARDGVRPGDLVMTAGYPGRTYRYKLAREVADRFASYYPQRQALLLGARAVIERATEGRPDAAIRYRSLLAGIDNTTKNYQGMLDGFAHSGILERRRQREQELRNWIGADPERRQRWGGALDELDAVLARQEATRERDIALSLVRRLGLLPAAEQLYRLSRERQKPDAERAPGYQDRDLKLLEERLERLDRRFDPEVDRALLEYLIARYRALPESQREPAFDRAFALDAEGLERLYAGTRLGDPEVRRGWIGAGAEAIEASDDPFLQLAVALGPTRLAEESREREIDGELLRLRPRYMEALLAYRESRGEPVYADANGTLRVSYGTVSGYSPRDGMRYEPFTTLEGIVEKHTGVEPFDVPQAELEAIAGRRYGRYRDESLESVPVDFLSDVDTTGGNSGSPTLNARGELVGLLFDGTYDSINGDWDFDRRTTRSIHVDMRYVLWVMDYIDRAHGLLRELGLEPDPETP